MGAKVPETVFLAKAARAAGAIAASAFGAGFGGSVWALVATEAAQPFSAAWQAAYEKEFPVAAATAEFFEMGPGPGAGRI